MTNKYKQEKTWAEENMRSHKYRCLCNTKECEVWRCENPGTVVFGFDIMITKYGISIHGDIDPLTFRVGSSYGIPFLAGKDAAYYIYSKLDYQCKKTELDKDSTEQVIIQRVAELLEDNDKELPKWWDINSFNTDYKRVIEYMRTISDYTNPDCVIYSDIVCFMEELEECTDLEAAHSYLEANCMVIDWQDWWDYDYSQPDSTQMMFLYMINIAAKEILKIKESKDVHDSAIG